MQRKKHKEQKDQEISKPIPLDKNQWEDLEKIIYSTHLTVKNKIRRIQVKKFSLNAKNTSNHGRSLLFEACQKEDEKTINFLINQGADINQADDFDVSPLLFTTNQRFYRLSRLLVERNAKVNIISRNKNYGHSPLSISISNDTKEGTDFAAYLLTKKADPNLVHEEQLHYPLFEAAIKKNFPIFKLLLKHGADPHVKGINGVTALHLAAEYGQLEMVTLLLKEYGVDPNCQTAFGETPLHYFIGFVDEKDKNFEILCRGILTSFKEAGANFSLVNKKNSSLLRKSIAENKWRVAKLLIEYGVDVNETCIISSEEDESNYIHTFLHQATAKENYPLIKFLLENGANINAIDQFEKSTEEDRKVSKELNSIDELAIIGTLKRKIKPWVGHETSYMTPLHIACKNGNLILVKFFCEVYSADINAQAMNGVTPLFLAAQEGHLDVVQFLLTTYADRINVNLKREDGHVALTIANQYQHRQVVEYIFNTYYVPLFKAKRTEETEYRSILFSLLNHSENDLVSLYKIFAILHPSGVKNLNDKNICKLPHHPGSEKNSARSYLLEQGHTPQDLKQWRENRSCQDEPGDEKEKEKEKTRIVSWLDGLITSSMPEIAEIYSNDHKTPNCYFYLDKTSLENQGASAEEINMFQEIILRFCSKENKDGFKKLKGEIKKIPIQMGSEKFDVKLDFELKKKSKMQRVLCFSLLSDDGSYTLIVGAHYAEKGLHKQYKSQLWKSPPTALHVVNLPPSAVKDSSEKEQTLKQH